jgi:hypothetical protein
MTQKPPHDEEQFGFDLGAGSANLAYEPDLAEIREDLAAILSLARGVTAASPWDDRTFRYNRIVFTQMARWLPDEERDQLCFEFSVEAERIEMLLAA